MAVVGLAPCQCFSQVTRCVTAGLRAFVLTNDKHFLDSFYEDREHAKAMESELRKLVSDNPEQTERNENSFQAFAAWSSWADQAIAMTKAGRHADDVAFQVRGKELMDQYRRARTEFIDREQQLRDERVARSRRTLELVNASIIGLAVLLGSGFCPLRTKTTEESFPVVYQRVDASRGQCR
jgi:CHASE3 domain sensor protein